MHDRGRVAHLVVGAVASFAVLFQLALVLGGGAVLDETDPPTTAEALGRFFLYFTIQSNILVAVTSLQLARDPQRDGAGWRVARTAAVVGITITGVVHFVLLRPLLDLDGADRFADVLLHQVVPVLAVLAWLVLGPRPRTGRREIGLALLWPVGWLLLILGVRALTGWVPYPFLDPAEQGGWGGVAVACVGVTLLFLVVSAAAYAVDRTVDRTARSAA
jgi:hypothetical protein